MRVHILAWMLVLCLIFAAPAYAYLDPGTGSMILQALAAVLVTCLVFFQSLRERIVSFFKRGPKNDASNPDDE